MFDGVIGNGEVMPFSSVAIRGRAAQFRVAACSVAYAWQCSKELSVVRSMSHMDKCEYGRVEERVPRCRGWESRFR